MSYELPYGYDLLYDIKTMEQLKQYYLLLLQTQKTILELQESMTEDGIDYKKWEVETIED